MCDELPALETVVGVSLAAGNSIKPVGDVITVDVLNKGADDVLKLMRAASERHDVSVTTHEGTSFIDAQHSEAVETDVKDLIVAGAGALAGTIIIAAYRRSVIAGALIALAVVPAAANVGAGLAAGNFAIALEGFERLGIDVLFVFVAGFAVFWLKQMLVRRRKPLI